MGLRINTNVQSLAAQRAVSQRTTEQAASMNKLSSGSRITKSADDAAGLAISERMRSGIRSVGQAERNANDGISLIQTAEGGMNEVSNILIRFRELAIQSASDTIGDKERSFIDKEVQQLKTEIDRIATSTEFNGRKLINGEGGPLEFQIGMNNRPDQDRLTYDPSGSNVTGESLGLSGFNIMTKEAAQESLMTIDSALDKVNENRSTLGALQNRMQSTVRNLQVYKENLSASESRIRDVDLASETAELTRTNILSQAGLSVLGQANVNNNSALRLLG